MKNLPLITLFCLVLFLRLFLNFEDEVKYKAGDKVVINHTFSKEPKKSPFGQYFFIDSLMVSIPLFPTYEFGDKVKIEGIAVESTGEKKDFLIVSNPKITKIDNSTSFLAVIKFVRQRIESSVMALLPAKDGGLLLGILLGVRDKIEPGYYERLKNVGVLHVVAASGQNVSIVAAFLLLLFERISRRRLAIIFTILGVSFYAFLTGFDPPIVRASIMAIFSFTALSIGKQKQSLYVLFLTAFLMLMVSPRLIKDLSFGLSFLSTWGIITIKPIFDDLSLVSKLAIIKDDISTTLSAQIATFPLIVSAFSSYSWLSFPVNILILWTIPFIMVFGGIGALLSLILPILGVPFYLLSFPFLLFFGFVVDLTSKYSVTSRFEAISPAVIGGYYLVLLAFLLKFKKT